MQPDFHRGLLVWGSAQEQVSIVGRRGARL